MPGSTSPTLLPPAEAAVARLLHAIDVGGLAVLCGPPGTGKTFVLDELAGRAAAAGHTVLRAAAAVTEAVGEAVLLVDAADAARDPSELRQLAAGSGRDRHAASHRCVILAGAGRLLTLVARDAQLREAVRLRGVLRPWRFEETHRYAQTRPTVAEALDGEAMRTLHELAAGVPRMVVRLLETAAVVLRGHPGRRLMAADIESFHRRLFIDAA